MAQTTQKPELVFFARPSLRRAYLIALVYAGLVLLGRFKTNLDPRLDPVWLGALVLLFAALGLAVLRRLCTSYAITTEEISVKSGILARKMVVVPLSRVTNALANQSFVERLLGLVTLQIDCAGGNAKEVNFQRITASEARSAGEILRELRNEAEGKNMTEPKTEQPEPGFKEAAGT
jgi:uncharacterized membrane protein YdbT with pleckstrin-like domain